MITSYQDKWRTLRGDDISVAFLEYEIYCILCYSTTPFEILSKEGWNALGFDRARVELSCSIDEISSRHTFIVNLNVKHETYTTHASQLWYITLQYHESSKAATLSGNVCRCKAVSGRIWNIRIWWKRKWKQYNLWKLYRLFYLPLFCVNRNTKRDLNSWFGWTKHNSYLSPVKEALKKREWKLETLENVITPHSCIYSEGIAALLILYLWHLCNNNIWKIKSHVAIFIDELHFNFIREVLNGDYHNISFTLS